jgi:hypothetical protein
VKGVSGMLDRIFFEMLCLSLITVFLVHKYFGRLVEDDDEDEDKNN